MLCIPTVYSADAGHVQIAVVTSIGVTGKPLRLLSTVSGFPTVAGAVSVAVSGETAPSCHSSKYTDSMEPTMMWLPCTLSSMTLSPTTGVYELTYAMSCGLVMSPPIKTVHVAGMLLTSVMIAVRRIACSGCAGLTLPSELSAS
jgi:hypothetical protein